MEGLGANIDCKIMVFRPSLEEFSNFSQYVKYMESQGAHKAGVAKIIPPKEWKAVKNLNMRRIGEMVIEAPVAQTVSGQQGLFQLFNVQKKPLKVKEFKELAESTKYRGPDDDNPENVERQFWKNIIFNQPIYGADLPGSIYDKDVKEWNVANLGTILDLLDTEYKVKISGVNTPYLYFGMWKTTFPWHTEDMNLYSINFLHFGAPKSWYSIPPEQGKRLESLAKGFFSGSFRDCPEFLRHKMTIISPHVLKKFSIPVNKITQYEGEFMITFPYGYHSGYNHGFNIAESTNFASERWIEYGKKAKHCQCNCDSVKIDMDPFIRKFQPEEWKKLLQVRRKDGQIDVHKNRKTARANYLSESPKKKKLKSLSDSSDSSESSDEDSDSDDDSENSSTSNDESSEEMTDTDTSSDSDNIRSSTILSEKNDNVKKKQNSSKENAKTNSKTKLTLYKNDTNSWQAKNKSPKRQPIHSKMLNSEQVVEDKSSKTIEPPMLYNMWNFQPYSLHAECLFNELLSNTEAKCAVCVYFSQNDADYLRCMEVQKLLPMANITEVKGPKSGKLLVTELCFALDNSEENSIETAFNLMFGNVDSADELSLLKCAKCNVSVHNSCYGVTQIQDSFQNWYCDKCRKLNSIHEKFNNTTIGNAHSEFIPDIKCCLCPIRGGALKETTLGSWCHIVCAISIPEVSFVNKKDRGPIDTSNLNIARKTLNCLYCNSHLSKPFIEKGACIQCKCGKCAMSFHVTCSFHHGVPLYLGDWPVFIETHCPKHAKYKQPKSEEKRDLTKVGADDVVLAKHKNGRYYRGRVIDTQTMLYYKVVFDDKSFCFDLPPDDIQGVDAKSNILPDGEIVEILWPDSVTYRAEVTGHWFESVSQVRFEDASILHVKRCDLYLEGEEIPKRVKSKLSYASEVANKFFIADSLQTGTKRSRLENGKCHSNSNKQ